MISAIAARKLAQAAVLPPVASLTLHPEDHVPSESSAEEQPLVSKPPSKRKSSAPATRHLKRKKKQKRSLEKTPRYFASDSFKAQEDIIVIDSDGAGSVISDQSDISVDPAPDVGPKRPWSPSAPLDDSSEEDADEDEDSPFLLAPTPAHTSAGETLPVLSTFLPVLNQNTYVLEPRSIKVLGISSSLGGTIVALRPSETICLLGTYILYVIKGTITVCGVSLTASLQGHRVYAPRSSPLPVIEAVNEIGIASSTAQTPPSLESLIQRSCAVVLLQELETGVDGLGSICQIFDGVFEPSRWQKLAASSSQLQLSGVHLITHPTKDVHAFELPSSWKTALSSSLTGDKVGIHLVKGPKNTGKSTFARTLLNTLLIRFEKVAYLECDLGQQEFTPGGMVAINVIDTPCFGPAFTHPTLPHMAHYIGATTPRSSPSQYLAAVQSLLEWYRLDVQGSQTLYAQPDDERISDAIPIVVNTMGWHKGLGADLTQKIQDMVEPTDIYEMETQNNDPPWANNFPPQNNSFMESQAKIHHLQPIPSSILSTNYTAADYRALSLLSYLHAEFPPFPNNELDQVTAMTWDTSLPLCARPPYEVDCAKTFDKIILTGAGMEDVIPSMINVALNVAIVGLVSCDTGTLDTDDNIAVAPHHIPYSQGFPVPSPATSRCHGLALIRSMSPTSSEMHVLTPLPSHLLARSKVLIKGEMGLPVWGMLDFRGGGESVAGVEKGKVPYLQWGKGGGLGGERRRVRRNLMRRGQL